MNTSITARFESRELVDAALGRLRLAGALRHTCSLTSAGSAGGATLHLTVRREDGPLARDIIRRNGGQVTVVSGTYFFSLSQ